MWRLGNWIPGFNSLSITIVLVMRAYLPSPNDSQLICCWQWHTPEKVNEIPCVNGKKAVMPSKMCVVIRNQCQWRNPPHSINPKNNLSPTTNNNSNDDDKKYSNNVGQFSGVCVCLCGNVEEKWQQLTHTHTRASFNRKSKPKRMHDHTHAPLGLQSTDQEPREKSAMLFQLCKVN